MATARKLPSGSYRCRVFSHYVMRDGKKRPVYESFTAPTKREAEAAAAAWAIERKARGQSMTVSDAVERYITAKTAVLSPASIRGYRTAQRIAFDDIATEDIRDLTSERVQLWISSLSATRAPKTVRNIYVLLLSACKMFVPGKTFSVSLPVKQKLRYALPSDGDIQKLLKSVEGTELWIALMLAYYYGLRRGEICALTSDDLSGDLLTISKDVVADENNVWVIKNTPKTADSYRVLKLSEPVLGVLSSIDGNFITCTPNALLARFRRAVSKAGIPPFNFHLLRHCYATRAATLGIADIFVAKMGGWKPGSPVLKSVYQNAMQEELLKQMDKMNQAIP